MGITLRLSAKRAVAAGAAVNALRRRWPVRPSPFRSGVGRPLIVHCSHHKAGTVWFWRILQGVAGAYRLRLTEPEPGEPFPDCDIAHLAARDFQTYLPAGILLPPDRDHRGTHMIRDPRDIVVSGYFYHQRAPEDWLQVPMEAFAGRTYQEYLRSVTQEEGLLAEISRVVGWEVAEMLAWKYDRPEFLELRYEEVMSDEDKWFERVFQHYLFDDRAVRRGLDIVRRARQTHRREVAEPDAASEGVSTKHVRSGQPGEWRQFFTPDLVKAFKESTGDAATRLGYESSPDWGI